jgi:hypothetical protein
MDELHGVAGKMLNAYSIMKTNRMLDKKGILVKFSISGIEWKYQE